MNRAVIVLGGLWVTGCSSPVPVDVGIDADHDAGHDAAIDVGLDSAMDGGVDAPLDAYSYEDVVNHDAFDPTDAWLDSIREATPVFLNSDPPDCSGSLAPPRWVAPPPPAEPQTVRWVHGWGPEFEFLTWGEGADRPSSFAPVLTGRGEVIWTWDDYVDVGLAANDGGLVHSGYSSFARVPDLTNPELVYQRMPRMWLPLHDGIRFAYGFSWTTIEYDSFRPVSLTGRVPIGISLPDGGRIVGSRAFDSWMPAWSPVSGDVVGVGSLADARSHVVLAACDAGVRWGVAFPQLPGSLWVRADGDVIVGQDSRVYVLDGATGVIERDVVVGVPGTSDHWGRAVAYQPGCGVLLEQEFGTAFEWVNDETFLFGPELRVGAAFGGGVRNWTGTPDCGLFVAARGHLIRFDADGSIRHDTFVDVPVGDILSVASPPIALQDGGIFIPTNPPGWIRLDAAGTMTERVVLPATVGTETMREPILAPDGTLYLLTGGFSPIRFSAVTTGAIPGPYLWYMSGINWARTNSHLPP